MATSIRSWVHTQRVMRTHCSSNSSKPSRPESDNLSLLARHAVVDLKRSQQLAASADMVPVSGAVEVDIPADELWEFFMRPYLWPSWNRCFLWAQNEQLKLGDELRWCFAPIRMFYPYVMPAVANIIELEPGRKVTWEVTALPGFYAHHTYSIDPLPGNRARFQSWEKATGWSFNLTKSFWLAHFTFVKDRSLEGALALASEYRKNGSLVPLTRPYGLKYRLEETLLTTGGMVAPLWFYEAYVKQAPVELAPGVRAIVGGGGNSLVVEDGGEVLLVDSKFPPGSDVLAKWLRKNTSAPVTKLVNTHYHYDHAQGNKNYPSATIYAHESVPELMRAQDGEYWSRNFTSVPTVKVPSEGQTLRVGNTEVELHHPGPAHTRGDLIVYLPAQKILVTGDLFFHTYYPFFDLSKAGVSLSGLIDAIEAIASRYPDAKVVPGHGPVTTSTELGAYGRYLRDLRERVRLALARGLSEDATVAEIAPTLARSVLPSFHQGHISWATADTNVRCIYQLVAAEQRKSAVSASKPESTVVQPPVSQAVSHVVEALEARSQP
jgi:glyoxylase-like metal-dependent hydrolase (beta-lactamase superfamily II)